MQPYCTSCYRDLPSEDAHCSCSRSMPATTSIVIGLVVFAMVMTGVLTLDPRLCYAGAAIGITTLAIQLIRR